jgi:hypothetical protein
MTGSMRCMRMNRMPTADMMTCMQDTMVCSAMSNTMPEISQKGCPNKEEQSSQKTGDEYKGNIAEYIYYRRSPITKLQTQALSPGFNSMDDVFKFFYWQSDHFMKEQNIAAWILSTGKALKELLEERLTAPFFSARH